MIKKSIQDILPLIEQPSRYLGSEINSIHKDLTRIPLSVVLAFPDLYEIGTSHFGLSILYNILNSNNNIAAERVFAPGLDVEEHLRSLGIPLVSLESGMPLKDFNIIGFSLLYELNYTNVINMLDLAEIPLFSSQRDNSYPLIIAGGPCTNNPEPVADFFDAMVIGDGESVIMDIAHAWFRWKERNADKDGLLRDLSRIQGVYIPSFFKAEDYGPGLQTLTPRIEGYSKVSRAIVKDLNNAAFPEKPIIPYGKPVHDRLRIEISRGCTRGCRFCQAGMIYRPVRERSPEKLLAMVDVSNKTTGYEDLSLLSLSTGDYGCIVPLMKDLMVRCEKEKIAVSFPSLRAGTLTPELMKLIKKVRKTGFTIAPEAGSQRLRDFINKNLTELEIIETVKNASLLGWDVIKLYFMVGLPSETDSDLMAIVDLVKCLRKTIRSSSAGGKRRRIARLNVSVATFIPKPHTPFQWEPQIRLSESRKKIGWLKKKLNMPGVRFKWQNPEVSVIEGIWARGNRKLSNILVDAFKKGCRFDGWSDKFNYQLWSDIFKERGLEVESFAGGRLDMDINRLPWDHIDFGITKEFLINEWEKSRSGNNTADCREGVCNKCGICDFKTIEPRVYENIEYYSKKRYQEKRRNKIKYVKYKFSYSKFDQGKYFGHLELNNIFIRALKRAEIPVNYTEGFHPKPKLSFEDPLPIGMESLDEALYLYLPEEYKTDRIIDRLNRQLPEGIRITESQPAQLKTGNTGIRRTTYTATLTDGSYDKKVLAVYHSSSTCVVEKVNRKGKKREVDLKTVVIKMDIIAPQCLQIELREMPGQSVRPFDVIQKVFSLDEDRIKMTKIVKVLSFQSDQDDSSYVQAETNG